MLVLRAIASLLSLVERIQLWIGALRQRHQPLTKTRTGLMFHVNHPYNGRYDSVNLVNIRTGLSLLFVIEGGSAIEVQSLVSQALRGEPIDRAPTAIIDTKAYPKRIPKAWD